jgi:hypothetical protein
MVVMIRQCFREEDIDDTEEVDVTSMLADRDGLNLAVSTSALCTENVERVPHVAAPGELQMEGLHNGSPQRMSIVRQVPKRVVWFVEHALSVH